MPYATQSPYPAYLNLAGGPLQGGQIFFGEVNQNPRTDPVKVYWDAAGTQPAVQPIRTTNGYTCRVGTPAAVFVNQAYSTLVLEKDGRQVFYDADSSKSQGSGEIFSGDLQSFGAVYGSDIDAQPAFALARSLGVKNLTVSGNIVLQTQVNATDMEIEIRTGATVFGHMDYFTGAKTSPTGSLFLFDGAQHGSIHGGGSITPLVYTDDRACIAVKIVSSAGVSVRNLDFWGFSKANGIVCIDTSQDILVDGNTFRDCTTNSSTTGQITGVVVDDSRVGGISSVRPRITNNSFHDLTVGASFLANFGYQTDGITIEVGTTGAEISGNTFLNLGEAIDNWGNNGAITGNTIRNCYIFGIKLLHNASYNVVSGNSIFGSGLAGIIVGNALGDTAATQFNLVTGNVIAGIDGAGNWSANSSACILLTDGGSLTFVPSNNVFSNNSMNPEPGGKYCILRASSTGGGNSFPGNHFFGSGSAAYVADSVSGLGRITATNGTRMSAYLLTAQTVPATTAAVVRFNDREFDDRQEFDNATNFRWVCQIPGVYEAHGQVTLGNVTGANKAGLLEIRKNGGSSGATSFIMASQLNYEVSRLVQMKVGEYLELWFNNGDAASVQLKNGVGLSFFTIRQA